MTQPRLSVAKHASPTGGSVATSLTTQPVHYLTYESQRHGEKEIHHMVNVNTHQVQQAIQSASEKLRLSKNKGQYFLLKMLIKDSQSSSWRVSFILPLTIEERQMEDVRPKIEGFNVVPKKSKAVETTLNSDDFINFNQVDVAIELAVNFMKNYKGSVSAEFMYVENSSELYIENNSELYVDKWDFVFRCVNDENQKLNVDIRVSVETQEVTVLEVINRGDMP